MSGKKTFYESQGFYSLEQFNDVATLKLGKNFLSNAIDMALGQTPDKIVEVTGETILKILGSFPEENRHCAFLAADTLQDALNDYMIKGRSQTGKYGQMKPNTEG